VTSIPQQQPNPSLVQMEELKPVMPLHPNPPPTTTTPTPTQPSGAANLPDSRGGRAGRGTEVKGRSGSPAVAGAKGK
jgi:hypothetical protein